MLAIANYSQSLTFDITWLINRITAATGQERNPMAIDSKIDSSLSVQNDTSYSWGLRSAPKQYMRWYFTVKTESFGMLSESTTKSPSWS